MLAGRARRLMGLCAARGTAGDCHARQPFPTRSTRIARAGVLPADTYRAGAQRAAPQAPAASNTACCEHQRAPLNAALPVEQRHCRRLRSTARASVNAALAGAARYARRRTMLLRLHPGTLDAISYYCFSDRAIPVCLLRPARCVPACLRTYRSYDLLTCLTAASTLHGSVVGAAGRTTRGDVDSAPLLRSSSRPTHTNAHIASLITTFLRAARGQGIFTGR